MCPCVARHTARPVPVTGVAAVLVGTRVDGRLTVMSVKGRMAARAARIAAVPAAAVAAAAVAAALVLYGRRLASVGTIRRLTSYEDGFDIYSMDILYDYDLEGMLHRRYPDDAAATAAAIARAHPIARIPIELPACSCSSLGILSSDGGSLSGRNYDFVTDTSALVVRCLPKHGYRSLGTMALDHVGVRSVEGVRERLATLVAPYLCLDGMNEKGVFIAIHQLDSEPTVQHTHNFDLFTTLAVRLVLDRAQTTQEAVDLLRRYDMHASSGRDYQFLINDASGDARVVEYDCESATRDLIDVPTRIVTNFYVPYIEKVRPYQRNGMYGHGRERYDRIQDLLSANEGNLDKGLMWEALQSTQQSLELDAETSNTQWSVVYDNDDLTMDIVLRRHWGDVVSLSLDARG